MNQENKQKIELSPEELAARAAVTESPETTLPGEYSGAKVVEQPQIVEEAIVEQSSDLGEQAEQGLAGQQVSTEGVAPQSLDEHHEELIKQKAYESSSQLNSVADASELMDLANLVDEHNPSDAEKKAKLNTLL